MNESWNKHIQPILDAWQHWDNFSWVWDPFFERYPKFSAEQKAQVDDALVTCAFDTTNEKSAIKALGIAGFLQNNRLASPRLIERMKNGLRDQVSLLDANSDLTFDYVVAIDFFEVKEAIPYIQKMVLQLEERKANGSLDERPSPHSHTFRDMLEKYTSILQDLNHKL
ncbi:MAG TPA: hypothetical protein VMT91_14300 [Anaerolineales bacterium]|nr:hypothetical protein [Anaerolineales bacterium]